MNRMTSASSLSSDEHQALHKALPQDAPAAARVVLQLLQRLKVGSLDVQFPHGGTAHFGQAVAVDVPAPRAVLRLHRWDMCAAVLKSGDIGFAEAYIAGHWSTPDLTALLKLFIANRNIIEEAIYGHWWGRLAYRIRHLLNRNSKANSRKNIQAHYDLGNDFYRLWLDRTMSYSSAWFEGDLGKPMVEAQRAKVKRALNEAGVVADGTSRRVLEIGCGWGGLAEIAAAEHGAHVTGVTLSTEQLAWAQRRMADAGLADRADLRLQDYRDIADAPFDAIVSIEMFEAVGREYWAGYFATLNRCLKDGGQACIQTITIDDALFDRYVKSTDFIQQYIFPGGMLPSPSAFRELAGRAGLTLRSEHCFGIDYAETLKYWRSRYRKANNKLRALGFDARFERLWNFYLVYCEAGFRAASTDVVQWELHRE